MPQGRLRRFLISSLVASVAAIIVIVAQNFALASYFPHLPRFTSDFSSVYLRRELTAAASASGQTIFLGDSVLWGYRVRPDQAMVSVLMSRGCACRNFAFKNGSPPNYYALARLLSASGARPKAVVLEINQKVFNQADAAYRSLHPAVATLAAPFLTPEDWALLAQSSKTHENAIEQRLDRAATSVSLLYAMRSDIRATLYADVDAAPTKPITSDMLEGAYDLAPLTEKNVGAHFLEKTVSLLRASGVPVIAFFTPTNHTLLHEYIDCPEYRANALFLRRMLERHGVRVLDLDRAFPASAFLDEVHLTAAAQPRLASLLAHSLTR
jgi:hypothetical protein